MKKILFFGLPGAGKTTLIRSVCNEIPNCMRVSGGSLISSNIPEVERDSLRKLSSKTISNNQRVLVNNYHSFCKKYSNVHILFDGHLILKDGMTEVIVPNEVIKALEPDAMVFVDVEESIIQQRRVSDASRPDREQAGLEELKLHRLRQLNLFESYAAVLNVPTFVGQEGQDVINFIKGFIEDK